MIKFSLDNAHPEFKIQIESTYRALSAKYPSAKLKAVSVYMPSGFDQSMGNADKPGEIELNGFWFSKHPDKYIEAAKSEIYMPITADRTKKVKWHGRMIKEPDHVLTHEFGHILADSVKGWNQWAEKKWKELTRDPESAEAGYMLDDPDELGAESFAEYDLGLMDTDRAAEFSEMLRGY